MATHVGLLSVTRLQLLRPLMSLANSLTLEMLFTSGI